jgi:hypothetical protein
MGVSLSEALGQVDLKAGQVYRCQVKGRWVELRVLDPIGVPPSRYDESDVMLDPWLEFPLPASSVTVVGEVGPLPAPDVPEMPADEDER